MERKAGIGSDIASLANCPGNDGKPSDRILVVEDSPTQAQLLRLILEGEGYEVEVAPDGEIGFGLFNAAIFDLVITDIQLPGISGYELCRKIKGHTSKPNVPVVLLTFLTDPMDIIQGLECGADNFITKSQPPDYLLDRVKSILGKKTQRIEGKFKVGAEVLFLGKRLTINSDKEQILDLLVSTFEDVVRTNRELQARERDLAEAKVLLDRYARQLEGQVRTTEEKYQRADEALSASVTERKSLEEQLRQAQKMEAIGLLAGGVAHDFNNLLTVISGCSEIVLASLDADDRNREMILSVYDAGERAALLTRQLLTFSRKQVTEPKILDLNTVVTGADKILQRLIGEDVRLTTVLAPVLDRVKADPGQIEQIVINLAVNARDAMPQGGRLTIETSNVKLDESYARSHAEVKPGRYVLLALSDTGCGMTEEVQRHIFEPFFTTKEPGKGTGLGLSTVFGIVKQSGGHVWAYSEVGRGSTFKIYLPSVEEAVPSGKSKESPPVATSCTGTILLVEDDDHVREMTRFVLQTLGYTILEARNGEEAMRICEAPERPVDLLITDVVMPGMSGRQVAEAAARLRPTIKVLYVSGYTDDAVVRHGVLQAETAFLQKPFTTVALAEKVREVLER